MKEKAHFGNLDALRTIACLFVFSEHILWNAFKSLDIPSPILSHTLYAIFGNGGLGVSIFFTLSGFLITYLILKEIEVNGRVNIKAFYIRRTLRIWPLYFSLLLFVFFIFPFFQQLANIHMTNPADKIYYFTFLSNFDVINLSNKGFQSFLQSGITWSISIEEQFYLVWPLLFLIVPKKQFIFIFISVIIASLIFRGMYHNNSLVIYFHTLGVCADLAVGGIAAYLIIKSQKFLHFFENMTQWHRVSIFIFGILYILYSEYYLDFEYAAIFRRIISSIFFAFVILQQCFDKNARIQLGRFKILSQLGKYTYGLYLLHPIGLLMFEILRSYFNFNADGFLLGIIKAIIVLLFSLILSYLSYRIIEQPFLKLKNKFSVA